MKGKIYHYYQKHRQTDLAQKPIKLPGEPWSQEWVNAYAAAANVVVPQVSSNAVTKLIDSYQISPEWTGLAEKTRGEATRYLERVRGHWGNLEVRGLKPRHILALRDQYAASPSAANALVRYLSAMLAWSVPRGWRLDNPCQHVKALRIGAGYAAWSRREIEYFRKHARPDMWFAAAFALYTGQRQGDVLAMRRASVRDGAITMRQSKTGKTLSIPIHPELKAIMAEMPRKSLHFLTTSAGTPWTQDGFKSSWQAEMDQRVFRPLRARRRVFHGLRKSSVVFLLECGCTTAEVAAISGQSMQMVEHYAQQVNQGKLARAAVLKWSHADARRKNEKQP